MVSGVLIRRPDSLLSLAEISGYIGVCGTAPVTLLESTIYKATTIWTTRTKW